MSSMRFGDISIGFTEYIIFFYFSGIIFVDIVVFLTL